MSVRAPKRCRTYKDRKALILPRRACFPALPFSLFRSGCCCLRVRVIKRAEAAPRLWSRRYSVGRVRVIRRQLCGAGYGREVAFRVPISRFSLYSRLRFLSDSLYRVHASCFALSVCRQAARVRSQYTLLSLLLHGRSVRPVLSALPFSLGHVR